MASIRTTKLPIGSAPWIVSERRQANELIGQEVEEFEYSVRNEMEWLNEHMHDIFAGNNMNVADIFKTPGKLRGKTPRTARKRNALGQRAPLTDIFAPNPQANPSPTKTQFYKQVAQFQVAEDAGANENQSTAIASSSQQNAPRAKGNADSGYHGMTDDEMDLDNPQMVVIPALSPKKNTPQVAQAPATHFTSPVVEDRSRGMTETEESFVSAKEIPSRNVSQENLRDDDGSSTVPDENIPELVAPEDLPNPEEPALAPETYPEEPVEAPEPALEAVDDDLDLMDEDDAHDDIRSPSDKSSPVKPLLRKSSLTFSSLPAREPLAHKKSMGARTSRTSHIDASKSMGPAGRFTGGKSLGGQQISAIDDRMDVDEADKPSLERQESETTKLHHQTTTQRLHDRINMLGQSRESRISKSIPLNTSASIYPQLPQAQLEKPESENSRQTFVRPDLNKQLPADPIQEDDDDDDWIAPVKSAASDMEFPRPPLYRSRTAEGTQQVGGKANAIESEMPAPAQQESPKRRFSPSRPKMPFGHKKTFSSSAISSPTRAAMAPEPNQKPISVSNPTLQSGHNMTTPAGSPRRHLDGAVSATKAKLYSALRSAKGIFASSAGVSAQAKMEAFSPAPRGRQQRDELFSPTEETAPEPALYPNLGDRITSAESAASASTEGRRTRSSSEREQKKKEDQAKQQSRMVGDLEKAREKERQKATAAATKLQQSPSKERLAAQRPMAPSRTESERSKDDEINSADEMPPPPAPRSMLPTTQAQRLREPRRIVKPMKNAPTKTGPTPVPIRMPSQRIGHMQAPSTSDLSRSLHESFPQPPASSKPALTSKPSSSSLHASSSTTSLKSVGSSQAAKKALEAAAKKREQDAKAAQRKAEQKREMEQRRAAKAEEERRRQDDERRKQDEERRRQEEERRAEQHRRTAEQQRREEAKRAAQRQAAETKRLEQQRKEAQRAQAQAQHNDFAYALQQEKSHPQAAQGRADLGNARPLSRMNLVPENQRPAVQVNPAKPPKRVLQMESEDEHSRPALQRNPPSYQQHDAKRRKTDEVDEPAEPRRSVMAPPVRQSNIRKENKFPHGYAPAPPPHHPTPSMFVKTVTAQHQLQHVKPGHQNDMAKFANARIPFADAPNPPGPSGGQFKTPGRPIPNSAVASTSKSSPLYPNGDNISLPEIASDSEDDEDEFQAPDWVNSPALRELLTQQQLVDPEQIFGPIAPLRMEEVFKNKDRHKKFRDRTSSANWNGQDRLTEEERQKDREAREKMMKDGGWTFQPN